MINLDGSIVTTNAAATEMTDYSSDEIREVKANDVFEGNAYSNWLRSLEGARSSKNYQELHIRSIKVNILTKYGHKIPGLMNCSPILDEKGILKGGLISVSDQTESLYMERALSENEEKLSKILRFANDAILMMDSRGRICFWSRSASVFFDYSEAEILGEDFSKLLIDAKKEKIFLEDCKQFFKTGEGEILNKTLELQALKKSGESFPIEISLSGYKVKNRWQVIGIVRDISDRKSAEKNDC